MDRTVAKREAVERLQGRFQTILAPFDAVSKLGRKGQKLSFAMVPSSFGGVVGMVEIDAAQ